MDCAWPFQAPRTGEPSESGLSCGESGIALGRWREVAVGDDGRGDGGMGGTTRGSMRKRGGEPAGKQQLGERNRWHGRENTNWCVMCLPF